MFERSFLLVVIVVALASCQARPYRNPNENLILGPAFEKVGSRLAVPVSQRDKRQIKSSLVSKGFTAQDAQYRWPIRMAEVTTGNEKFPGFLYCFGVKMRRGKIRGKWELGYAVASRQGSTWDAIIHRSTKTYPMRYGLIYFGLCTKAYGWGTIQSLVKQ